MKALLLDGTPRGESIAEKVNRAVENGLEKHDYEVERVELCDKKIGPCVGCFGCWVKTPGVCVIDDAGREIAKAWVESGVAVFITAVTFGGYSYEMKKAFDRLIPNLSPYFRRVDGEIHHKMRYNRYPRSLILGILPKPDPEKEKIFKILAKRNSLNYESPAWAVGVLYETQSEIEIRNEIKELVEKILGKGGGSL